MTPQPSPTQNNVVKREPEPQDTPSPKPTEIKTPRSSNKFTAFSGSASPFASYSSPNGISPFALGGQKEKAAPAWRRTKDCAEISTNDSPQITARSPNDILAEETSTVLQTIKSSAKQPHSRTFCQNSQTFTQTDTCKA